MELSGTTVLVTGAACRVGCEIALALAAAGCDLIVHYNTSESDALETARRVEGLGRRATVLQADLSDWDSTERFIACLDEKFPDGIDGLVNCASAYPRTPIAEVTEGDWNSVINANLRGPFQLARWAGLKMKAGRGGVIVNITDCAVDRVYRGFAPYLVSKGGLDILTRVLAHEFAPEVRVVSVAPGTVLLPDDATEGESRAAEKRALLGRVGIPQDVASAVVFVMKDADYMTGWTVRVDGGAAIR